MNIDTAQAPTPRHDRLPAATGLRAPLSTGFSSLNLLRSANDHRLLP